MLLLSRRCDEKIVFPGLGITVQVLQIKGNQIKIGIDAPPSVTIMRHELEQALALRVAEERSPAHRSEDLLPLCRKG